ncbi:UNVERIFIED_CONTAM: hypothetical protein HDU68_010725 [Siphonaria sp. JEL0065]|nr:hypothetical protein HDU68_010725 [Siphonaria sp. JEL0065]
MLKSAWFSSFPHDVPLAQKWWQTIERAYQEPQRSYHTSTHIELVILLATCFHDIVYDPKAKDNERKSADLFLSFASEAGVDLVPTDDVVIIEQLILATIKHEPIPPDSSICRFFLDLDLSILAASWEDYCEYAKGIRVEYCIFSDAEFKTGRASVLERFLQRETLYFTPGLKEKWEALARENISRELLLLKD